MKRIFWLPIAVIFMIPGALTKAQVFADSLPLLEDPALKAATNARVEQSNLFKSQAKAALKKGEIPKAVILFEQALKAFDIDVMTRITLADIYIQQGKTDDVIRILKPMIYPDPHISYSEGHEVTVRMKYVLALLDKNQWEEAVAIYEGSFAGQGPNIFGESKNGELKWQIPGGGPVHTLPEVHFSVENPDFADLQAQAHLILGCREPLFSEYEDRVPYMLAHLKQAIKYDRFSLDAHFLSGILLAKLERFDEARAAFKLAAGLAPAEAKPEIAAALKDLQVQEAQKKAKDAIKAAQQAAAAKQAPQPTDH